MATQTSTLTYVPFISSNVISVMFGGHMNKMIIATSMMGTDRMMSGLALPIEVCM